MLRMFFEANQFDKDIGQRNVWNVECVECLCFLEQLNSAEILSGWDIRNVMALGGMFDGAIRYQSVRWC
jgi:hypothetical protein